MVIAADFYFCTGTPLCNADDIMGNYNIEQICDKFRRASRTMMNSMRSHDMTTAKDIGWHGELRLAVMAAVRGRLKISKPKQINQLLHKIAIKTSTLAGGNSER